MLAVSAWFDEGSEAVVRELWLAMADAAVDASLHGGPYRPHVTLGVWDGAAPGVASGLLRPVASVSAPFPLAFRAVGIFPGDPTDADRTAGVYLTPTVTSELRDVHERVHAAMRDTGAVAVDRHRPGRWEPHCTVAWRLAPQEIGAAAKVVLDAGVLPLETTVTRLGLIETPAEVECGCLPFGPEL